MTATLETARLRLKELEPGDYSADYLAWLQDPEINQYLETRHAPQSRESIIAFIEGVLGRDNETLFGIFLKDGGRHIGNIKAGPVNPYHRVGDVSLFIGERGAWGRGYAAEAIGAVSRYAFDTLGAEKLSASMYSPNAGSKHAFLNAGYREEGLRRSHYRLASGRCDVIELGLVPADLEPAP